MTLGLCFYILMLLWLVFGLYWSWPAPNTPFPVGPVGGTVLLFLLLLLLGWSEFGPPLHR